MTVRTSSPEEKPVHARGPARSAALRSAALRSAGLLCAGLLSVALLATGCRTAPVVAADDGPAHDSAAHGGAAADGAQQGRAGQARVVAAPGDSAAPPRRSALAGQQQVVTVTVGGVERVAQVHFPSALAADVPVPVLYLFHGLGDSNEGFAASLSAQQIADRFPTVVVVPQGLENPGDGARSWNAGACCAFGDPERDDLAFFDALHAEVLELLPIDTARVFAGGFSNGGFFSERLACERSAVLTGALNVGGAEPYDLASCEPEGGVRIVRVHGTGDTRVPFTGGAWRGNEILSFDGSFARWHRVLSCSRSPELTYHGRATCRTVDDCRGGAMRYCRVDGLGHSWPRRSTESFDVLDVTWSFWEAGAGRRVGSGGAAAPGDGAAVAGEGAAGEGAAGEGVAGGAAAGGAAAGEVEQP